MRTVTFSDPDVVKYIRDTYVPVWINRGAGFHNEEYSTEEWIYAQHAEAYLTKNICTFFLNEDGRVYDYLAGSYAPELFLHLVRGDELVEMKEREYRGFHHRHTDACAKTVEDAKRYRAALQKVITPQPFEDLRFEYCWGNSFTEETRGAPEIRGRKID